jgi:hypothetical protein
MVTELTLNLFLLSIIILKTNDKRKKHDFVILIKLNQLPLLSLSSQICLHLAYLF